MKGYITNIEKDTLENSNFRTVLFTAKNLQLTVMSLKPGEDIGLETHEVDQFIRIEKGEGVVIMDGIENEIKDDFIVIIPAGTEHNVINKSADEMKLYSIYAPAEHPDKTIDKTKEDAEEREGHE